MLIRKRLILELSTVLLMLVAGATLSTFTSWGASHIVHVSLETFSIAGTSVLAALGFLSFVDTGQRRALYQGATFLAARLMDLLHVAPFAREQFSQIPGLAPLTCTGGWYGAKVLLGGGMVLAILAGNQIAPREQRKKEMLLASGSATLLAGMPAAAVIMFFPSDSAALHESPVGGPLEVIPLLLFLTIGISLMQRAEETFTHYLGRSMLVAAWSQALMVFSSHVNDLPFIAAHMVKVASAGVALAGIIRHYTSLFQFTRRAAEVDALTGLANLHHLLSTEQDQHTGSAFMLIDIDHFKQINDRYGHLAGDTLLTQVAGILKTKLGQSSTLARYGGDEFAALFHGLAESDVVAIGEQARVAVAETNFTILYRGERVVVRLTVSIGVASGASTVSNLLEAADKAAYKAKALGRNRVVRFTDQLLEEVLPESSVAIEHMDRLASISQVVGRLAHQITPPLLEVQSDLEQIRQGRRVTPAQVDKAVSNLRQVDYLLRSLQELSTPDGSPGEAMESTSLTRLLDPVLAQVNALASARKAHLNMSLTSLDQTMICEVKLL